MLITSDDSASNYNADLVELDMIRDMMDCLDVPSDISKSFAVRKALYTALNHTPDNITGYDATLRIKLYGSYERSSLNISAKLFNSFMAFLMKPKMIIQGMPTTPIGSNEPGFFGRLLNKITGRGQPTPAPQVQGVQQ